VRYFAATAAQPKPFQQLKSTSTVWVPSIPTLLEIARQH
jgi:hypothetical protein